MGLGGGGGGGGGGILGVSGSFTGPAEALDIYGDFAAAYSGVAATTTSANDYRLQFKTGNYLFVGEIQATYRGDSANNISYIISMNGAEVFGFEVTSSRDYTPHQPVNILIPAYTEFTVALRNLSGGSDIAGVSIIGRIYRT